MDKILFLFKNTRLVIKGEKVLNDKKIKNKIVPVPKKYSSNCGMAIEISPALKTECEDIFKENGIEFSSPQEKIKLTTLVNAGGCSAKLDPKKLEKLLSGITNISHPDLLVSASTHDDAGVVRIGNGKCLIQTLDFFPPVVDDAYEFGQIAAANALSDVYAMGGVPLTAMNIVLFPATGLDEKILREIIEGGADKVKESGAFLVGGHTIDNSVPIFGCSITGISDEKDFITNSGANEGDILVLTKKIGTGIILAADKVNLEGDYNYQEVADSMKRLNNLPVGLMKKYNIKGGTDITGFGLFGHAYRFAAASNVTFEISLDKIPIFNGVEKLIENGCIPGGCIRNLEFTENNIEFKDSKNNKLKWAAFDPQTSGGLLISIDQNEADMFLSDLIKNGVEMAAIIGKVTDSLKGKILVSR